MSYRERLAINYSFFRFPSHYILVLIPLFTGIIAFLTTEQSLEPGSDDKYELILNRQMDLIEIYLTAAKLGLIVALAFFLNYRWAAMERDGAYGYWLTQSIKRGKFYTISVGKFFFDAYMGITLGLLFLIFPGGLAFDISVLIGLFLLLAPNVLIIVLSAIFIGEIVKDAELSPIIFIRDNILI